MECDVIDLPYGFFFKFYDDHPDDDLELLEFLELIGLDDVSYSIHHATYKVIDKQKWFLAKIRYGI